ncbi:DNA-directed RNA polymerase subunit delta [Jeotgalibacillus sp. R-1-5s-1]|uniref:DNA-directed RNA polymerase subunit delta n=1 Tax=Jeotgalibacillus sp. R-1-5s-1 TaxID=2555897 RepID=UPI00106C605D|nr:DNA-directed RNA polymerase subunit delta [Jeotgalibacillus sp. R-1-5s-1]TFD92947.1 DNA-directed RNA polymerase subunit delta [Jeotgalibacillus sp. R-1-5s-1]
MELKNRSVEDLREYSFIEIAHQLLVDRHDSITFNEMVSEWQRLLGLTDKQAREKIVQFYTDLNMDGRFIYLGAEKGWGLRSWYPLDQVEDEQVTSEIQTKKKTKSKKKKVADEDLDFDDLDDEEDDLAYDELDDDVDDVDDLDEDDDEDFDDELDSEDFDDIGESDDDEDLDAEDEDDEL